LVGFVVFISGDIKDGTVIDLTPSDIHRLSQGDWFVEIYAPWCGFCKKMVPIYDKVASGLKGKVHVARIDGDQYKDLAMQFFVSGFPTIYFIHDGEVRAFDADRKEESFIEFSKGGYKSVEPVPVYMNPLSFVGKFVGFFGKIVQSVIDIATDLQETYHIPIPVVVVVAAIGTALFALVAVMVLEAIVGAIFGGSSRTPPSTVPATGTSKTTTSTNHQPKGGKTQKKRD